MNISEIENFLKTLENQNDNFGGFIGKKVIIRTYSAGVWYGELKKKSGREVILINARRMYFWSAAKSISLSGVAKYGIKGTSKICPRIESIWLEAIEILELSKKCINDLEGAPDVEAE